MMQSTTSRPPKNPRTRREFESPTPIRTCIGCRTRRPQHDLIRLGLDEAGRVVVDRHAPGRGAWLCAATAVDCLAVADGRHALTRALRRSPDGLSVEALAKSLEAARSGTSS